jgi:membrane-bound lytic murein transglycosylase D
VKINPRIDDSVSYADAQNSQFSTNWGVEEQVSKRPVMAQRPRVQRPVRVQRLASYVAPSYVARREYPRNYSVRQKLTEETLDIHQILANLSAEETPDTSRFMASHQHSFGQDDLWKRVSAGYGLPMEDNERVQRFIEKYVNYPASLRKIARNATPYLYHIVEEVEKRGMPLEIALLPAIESLYQPIARSHKSAVGIWQFMSATGGEYGLVQNSWYDGRRDIIKSTTAALDYLQSLHQSFDYDWLLALAAYNTGPGNVRKAIKRNRARGKSTDFWSLRLPRETREYVPKLLALSEIVANHQYYGLDLQAIANRPYFERVYVGRLQIDLFLAARLAGLSLSKFKQLNPGHKRKETSPMGSHYIVLPVETVQLFKQRLDRVLARMS